MYFFRSDYLKIVFIDAFPVLSYLLSRIWESISDFYGRRKPFIILGYMLGSLSLALAGFAQNMDTLIALILVMNFFYSIDFPALYATLGYYGGREIYGLVEAVNSLGWMIGATLLGYIHLYGGQLAIYITGSFLIFLFLLIILFLREPSRKETEFSFLKHVESSLKLKLRAKSLFKYLLASSFIAWIATLWNSALLKVKLYLLVGESLEYCGLTMGLGAGLLSIIASFIATVLSKRYGGVPILTLSLLLYSVSTPLLALTQSTFIYITFYILPVWSFFYIGQLAAAYELSESGFEAENIGTLTTIAGLSSLPALVGGVIADLHGINIAILSASLLYLSALLALILAKSKLLYGS